jgi:hypothetical protein
VVGEGMGVSLANPLPARQPRPRLRDPHRSDVALGASAEEDHPELSNEPRMEVKNDQARLCPARFRSATIPVAASTIESRIRIADDTPGVG